MSRSEAQTRFELIDPAIKQLREIKQLRQSLETRLAEIELLPAALLRSAFNGN
jgi:hypothetical protein